MKTPIHSEVIIFNFTFPKNNNINCNKQIPNYKIVAIYFGQVTSNSKIRVEYQLSRSQRYILTNACSTQKLIF